MADKPNNQNSLDGPLSDLRVLEFGSMLAGPFVGTMLADFGAEVIKVEKPGMPDAIKQWPPSKDGQPLIWKSVGRGKRLITLDISKPAGRDIALELIKQCDVVVENFRPGTMERWGFDPESQSGQEGGPVWVRVSGYGQTGPKSSAGGYATIAEAYSGLSSFTGYPDRGPMVSPFPMADYLAGTFGAFGALAAIHERRASGRGQVVDATLFEPLLRIIDTAIVQYDQLGASKPRLGNQMQEDVPRNVYATADGGFVALSIGSDQLFRNLLDAIGHSDLKDDPRFINMQARADNRDETDLLVADWMAANSTQVILETMERHRVVVGKVFDMADVFGDAHVAARDALTTVNDPELGDMRLAAPVPKLSRTPGNIRWTGKATGADNQLVFGEYLNMTPQRVEELAADGII